LAPTTPPDSAVVVMLNSGPLIVMLSFCVAESGPPCAPEESVTFTVNSVVPAALGVPEIVPVPLKERPAGKAEPEPNAQERVPAPPVTCNVTLYAAPTVPLAREVEEMVGAGAMLMVDEPDFVESDTEVAVTVTVILAETEAGAL
jgi:hypothetical protein